ncbi:MAG: HAMP domain-containing sensor histidine kinase [Polyangiaceae bacterium]
MKATKSASSFDRHRLPMRMFLYGVVLLIASLLAVSLSVRFILEPRVKKNVGGFAWVAVSLVAQDLDNPEKLARSVALLRSEGRTYLSLYRPNGELIVSTVEQPPAPLSASDLTELKPLHTLNFENRRAPVFAVGVFDDNGGLKAYGIHEFPALPPAPTERMLAAIPIVLVVLALVSLPLTRSLLSPLSKILAAARAFGQGNMGARTGLRRSDELGELAVAFDDMAERIASLRRSEKELLANVSHELRTPIARIRVVLELASDSTPEETTRYLGEITEDLSELERLVEDVLQTTRLELNVEGAPASIPTLRLERVAAASVVERSTSLFRTRFPERALDTEVQDDSSEIMADVVLLRRAVDNLLDNARKYSDAGSVVSLQLRSSGAGVEIVVKDQGIGIDEADQEHVFTPFFRTERSRAKTIGGVGLGLTLVQKVAQAHGGTVSLESRRGEGTTVRLVLPFARALLHHDCGSPPAHATAIITNHHDKLNLACFGWRVPRGALLLLPSSFRVVKQSSVVREIAARGKKRRCNPLERRLPIGVQCLGIDLDTRVRNQRDNANIGAIFSAAFGATRHDRNTLLFG